MEDVSACGSVPITIKVNGKGVRLSGTAWTSDALCANTQRSMTGTDLGWYGVIIGPSMYSMDASVDTKSGNNQ